MDGFFEKYGRVIIVAVAICFVLLYLTPMRNVVGSSINGFAGNFANKVGESLRTVKMPYEKEKSSMLIDGPDFKKKVTTKASSIIFTDEIAPKEAYTIDLTVVQDGSVVGWKDRYGVWKISTQDKKKAILFNTNSASMFYYPFLKNIDFHNVDTSNVTSMRSMFYDCGITNLDLSSFDTSQVTDMAYMFNSCSNLISVNLSSFDTSKVTDMRAMFWRCSDLTNLDLSSFDTSNVTDMNYMFHECYDLTSVNLSSFDTSNVKDMSSMFESCESLESLDLSSFNFNLYSSNLLQMFSGCGKLTKVLVQSQKELNFVSRAPYTPLNVKFEIK